MSSRLQKTTPAGAVPLASPGSLYRAHRKALQRTGFVGIPGMRLRVPCTLLNMSATGARVVLLSSSSRIQLAVHLPDEIILVLPSDRSEVSGLIRWRDDDKFGIQFTSAFRATPA